MAETFLSIQGVQKAYGPNVVVLARYTATNKVTSRPLNVRVAHHFIVRGGLIVRFEQFVDTAAVRTAMDPATD